MWHRNRNRKTQLSRKRKKENQQQRDTFWIGLQGKGIQSCLKTSPRDFICQRNQTFRRAPEEANILFAPPFWELRWMMVKVVQTTRVICCYLSVNIISPVHIFLALYPWLHLTETNSPSKRDSITLNLVYGLLVTLFCLF